MKNKNELQKCTVEHKKPETKEYILHNSINIKLRSKQKKKKTRVIEVRIVNRIVNKEVIIHMAGGAMGAYRNARNVLYLELPDGLYKFI